MKHMRQLTLHKELKEMNDDEIRDLILDCLDLLLNEESAFKDREAAKRMAMDHGFILCKDAPEEIVIILDLVAI